MQRVWRALCDPDEVVRWDSAVMEALDPPPDYPKPSQHVRWRCRTRLFRILHDRPQEVVEGQKLRSLLTLGPSHMDETYLLTSAPNGCRLNLDLELRIALPLAGGLIERLYAGEDTRRGFEASLAGLKRHCEADNKDANLDPAE